MHVELVPDASSDGDARAAAWLEHWREHASMRSRVAFLARGRRCSAVDCEAHDGVAGARVRVVDDPDEQVVPLCPACRRRVAAFEVALSPVSVR